MKTHSLLLLSGWLVASSALATTFDTSLAANATFTITAADGPAVPGEAEVYLGGETDCALMLGEHPYAVRTITPSAAGAYTLETLSPSGGVDTLLAVYSPSFDPAHPSANLIACNDDYDSETWPLSRVVANLSAGTPYTVVLTTWNTTPLMNVIEETEISQAVIDWRVTPDLAPAAAAVAPVPVLGPWGMALLMAALGVLGIRFGKKREV